MQTQGHGIILSAMSSGSGKTTLTALLLSAFRKRGLAVQPYKAGPDYIDPAFHAHFWGSPSRNLDAWLMGREGVLREVARTLPGKLGLLEGVMGLFDGYETATDEGSTMELARWLGWPVILVIPAAKQSRSLAAALRGFIAEAGEGRIAGVILNGVGSASHRDHLAEILRPLGLPLLGALPKDPLLQWPERHLGLQASQELRLPHYEPLAELAGRHLDLPAILSLCRPSPEIEKKATPAPPSPSVRIGIARDEAFHFYYPSALESLESRGVRWEPVSLLHDPGLPTGLDGLFIGGGFPEAFAPVLSRQKSMHESIRAAVADGMPLYAECGGLMVCSEALIDSSGASHPMLGLLPGHVEMTPRLQHFGYATCMTPDGEHTCRGHEFHHSLWSAEPTHANLWHCSKHRTGRARTEGFRHAGLHASYVHVHFEAHPWVAETFLKGQTP